VNAWNVGVHVRKKQPVSAGLSERRSTAVSRDKFPTHNLSCTSWAGSGSSNPELTKAKPGSLGVCLVLESWLLNGCGMADALLLGTELPDVWFPGD
jgi:hypothetical protein